MSAFTATGRLARLALRRDRVKLPVWIAIVVALFAATVPAVKELYGLEADRFMYAVTNASSIVTRVLSGPMGGDSIGAIVLNEGYLFAAILIAFMSTLAVIRHTRQNEETGRAELIGSAVVGRHAMLTAALAVVIGANIITGILISLVLIGGGLPAGGSVATGAALGATGIVFAAIAAVAAQLSESARGANSLAAAAIGVTFVLRGIGDGMGRIVQDGTVLESFWPSYISPIGWGQQVFPYSDGQWWWLGLFVAAFILLTGFAFFLTSRRDVGMSMIAPRPGPARARPGLLSTTGLAWRLQRGTVAGWSCGLLLYGLMIGLMAKEFKDFVEQNEGFANAMSQIGGSTNPTEALLSALMVFGAVAVAGFALQSLQRLRSEEAAGRAEPVLATGVGRFQWVLSHVLWAGMGIMLLLSLLGLTAGVSYVLVVDAPWSEVWPLFGAALAHLPAVLSLSGFALLLFGAFPGAFTALSWGMFGISVGVLQLGVLLKLPQWAMDISPFIHSPSAPAQAVTVLPLATMAGIGLTLAVAGMIFFRRRDITC